MDGNELLKEGKLEDHISKQLEARVTDLGATMEPQHTMAQCGTSSTQSVSATFETQVQILEDVIGVTDGTRIRGVGCLPMRDSKSKQSVLPTSTIQQTHLNQVMQ